jgi:hypothetical protein
MATPLAMKKWHIRFTPSFVNYKNGCTRLAAASDKVYQLFAHGRWFFPGTLVSSTTKTGRHDIAEILLKVALNTKIQIQILLYATFSLQEGWPYKRGTTVSNIISNFIDLKKHLNAGKNHRPWANNW